MEHRLIIQTVIQEKERRGGKLIYMVPNKNAMLNAKAKSPTRKKAIRRGKYVPTEYMSERMVTKALN